MSEAASNNALQPTDFLLLRYENSAAELGR